MIDTSGNTVSATIGVGGEPFGVAVTPDGSTVYVTNANDDTVSVIDTATNTVTKTIPGLGVPIGVAVTPDGSAVYVANSSGSNTVSVIDTATKTVTGSPISVGSTPEAFGIFIQPAAKFAGTPGQPNCYGKSVSALATK